jgi:hypothetical protein
LRIGYPVGVGDLSAAFLEEGSGDDPECERLLGLVRSRRDLTLTSLLRSRPR